MTSFFGASRTPTGTPSNPAETAARVENLKNSIKNELALQNVQELMNVSAMSDTSLFGSVLTAAAESDGKVLRQVRPKTWL